MKRLHGVRRRLGRVRLMADVGIAMMLHARLKLVATLAGVVFAVLLVDFALGTFFGLLARHTMFVANANADLWIVPRGAELVGQGSLDLHALHVARTTPGVVSAAPVIMGAADVTIPGGRHEGVSLVGVAHPYDLGGPWNVVAGDTDALRRPDTLVVESSVREGFGGLNLGSVREIGGRRMVVGGFTWGLVGIGPSYAFADFETAREVMRVPRDRASLVLVRTDGTRPREEVARAVAERTSGVDVYTTDELVQIGSRQLLTKSPVGVTFGAITIFGLLVGVVVVGLSMLSAVVDNIREFGMMKAVGCSNTDLGLLLAAQSMVYALLGSALGLALVGVIARTMRSPNMGLELPWELSIGTVAAMVLMCTCASLFSLVRVRKVEPGMVFR